MAKKLGERFGKFLFCLLGIPIVLSVMVIIACVIIISPILVLINPDVLEVS